MMNGRNFWEWTKSWISNIFTPVLLFLVYAFRKASDSLLYILEAPIPIPLGGAGCTFTIKNISAAGYLIHIHES
jgi:hypothetical protein